MCVNKCDCPTNKCGCPTNFAMEVSSNERFARQRMEIYNRSILKSEELLLKLMIDRRVR